MKCRFEKVVDGLVKWIDAELYPHMNDAQELVARLMVSRIAGNTEALKVSFINNGIVRTFGIIDSDGMIDIDALAADIKKEIERKGKIVLSVPMFGKMTFVPGDVDTLKAYITEGYR